MKKDGFYSSGEFAKMAHITKKTLRYYDAHNILKPSYLTPYGARFYSDEDFARLQQILLLKYLGFSLDDIREMTINDSDYHFMADALKLQRKLVQDKIEQLQLVERAIQDTSKAIEEEHSVNWSQMLKLIHLTGMEKSMKTSIRMHPIFPHVFSFIINTARTHKAGFPGSLINATWQNIRPFLSLAAVMVLYGLKIKKKFQNSSMSFFQIFQKECFVIPGVPFMQM